MGVPKVQVVARVVDVPVVRKVQRTVEVPQIQTVQRVVDVPVQRQVEQIIEVPKIQTVQRVVQEPYTTYQEQIIEVPRVEYQDVEGSTYYESVQAPSIQQAQAGTTRQERVVGPPLEPVVMQSAPAPQPVATSYAAPVATSYAA